VLLASGVIKCWGNNTNGELGTGSASGYSTIPLAVVAIDASIDEISASTDRTCAVLASGGVKCWGYGSYYATGQYVSTYQPTTVAGIAGPVVSFATGVDHTCFLLDGGAVQCVGRNDAAQSGAGYVMNTTQSPADVIGLDGGILALGAASHHACALMSNGTVRCFGNDAYGRASGLPPNDPRDVVFP
jgi:alpha-tubulin suppressor-like RCC1 family protein